ncbi:hypothetical protein G3576_22775 [Roseomonas stagni]|uniref:Porin n=1 Tax=Falsiroseomonas algicola TaxID=2716930 RepID=A0A6M1LR10_9PROT|nr:hypothetical protein [Falsiroseomonas algicola]NGM22855.1 hypothetical protein [Falsiroseomonas algicola]
MRWIMNGAAAAMLAAGSAPAGAQEVRPQAGFVPHVSGELAIDLYGVSTYRAPSRTDRFRDLYTKTELTAGLHLAESVTIQGVLKFEPVAGGPTDGQDRAFQDQGAWVESLYAEWRADPRLTLTAGKFTAPFGRGWDNLPGIRLTDQVSIYEVSESLGFGARATVLDDADGWGEHRLSAAVFTFDTTSLSSTAITRKRFGRDEADRYRRNSRGLGGAGNTGELDNVAVALEGERMGALPGFTYQVAVLSRGAGTDGRAREWGTALGASWEIPWTEEVSTTLFAEAVRFRNAGGRPVEEVDGTPLPISERRTITTLAAQTTYGPWRASLGWQVENRDRSANGVARATYLEASLGRELGLGFTADIGWSRTRAGTEEGGRGSTDAGLVLVGWRQGF